MSEQDWPDNDTGLVAAVVAHYRQALGGSVEALGWLERRRIAEAEALERFQIGFGDRTLGYRLPAKSRSRDDDVRGRLQRLGVLRGSGHEQFRGAVTFPVLDAAGEVLQVYGRTLDDERSGAGRHRWLPALGRGVWNLGGLDAERVVVCEGIVDAMSLWVAGFRSVTACAGPDGFDDELADTLVGIGVRRVVIAFDADQAGDAGAVEVARRLGRVGVSCARLGLPVGMDVNDVAVGARHPQDALARLLRHVEWIDSTPPPPRPAQPAPTTGSAPVEPAPPPPAATPQPTPQLTPQLTPPAAEVVDGELRLNIGDRRWRVRGLQRASSFESLKLNVLAGRGERFHVDTFDLMSAKSRQVFVAAAAAELRVDEAVIKGDVGRVLLACEAEAERVVRDIQAPTESTLVLSERERTAALELLQDPHLVDRVVADFARVGVVGEASNCLVGYLAAVSRRLERPLAVVVQSTSAAGKSALVDAVLGFVPPEDVVRYSAVTGQALFYMGGGDLAHKVLAVAEEEGAARAAYALKLLQSDGELSIASTGKDGATGRLTTHTYRVQGPTAIFLTTTAIDVDEELLNRCLVLTVDETPGQTRAIHERQRTGETLAGLVATTERDAVVNVHRNAQRLLEPVAVVNPFAEQLTFADTSTRTRRDHAKYLGLIRAVTFLHQHQREHRHVVVDGVEVVYVESTVSDIATANRIAHDVLGRSLDELPPQTRRLLGLVHDHVNTHGGERFTRRELREAVGWGDTQLKVHLARLVDLELVHAERGDHGGFVYTLAWNGHDGVDGGRFVIGLRDPATLTAGTTHGYDGVRSGQAALRSGPGRGAVGPRSGSGRTGHPGSSGQINGHKPADGERDDADRIVLPFDDDTVVVAVRKAVGT